MTRKDYILIADVFRSELAAAKTQRDEYHAPEYHHAYDVILQTATRMANNLNIDNPRFDTDHFMAVVRGEKELNSRP